MKGSNNYFSGEHLAGLHFSGCRPCLPRCLPSLCARSGAFPSPLSPLKSELSGQHGEKWPGKQLKEQLS